MTVNPQPEPPILFVDLDRTILNSEKFSQIVAAASTRITGRDVNPADHHTADGCNYSSLTAHMASHLTQFETAVKQVAKRAILTLIYPDVWPLLRGDLMRTVGQPAHLAILTFGDPQYQRLKIDSLTPLHHMSTHIVQEPKRDYITRNFPHRTGWLVDDKPGQNLPHGWGEIHLDRSAARQYPQKMGDNITQICELGQIADAIRTLNGTPGSMCQKWH